MIKKLLLGTLVSITLVSCTETDIVGKWTLVDGKTTCHYQENDTPKIDNHDSIMKETNKFIHNNKNFETIEFNKDLSYNLLEYPNKKTQGNWIITADTLYTVTSDTIHSKFIIASIKKDTLKLTRTIKWPKSNNHTETEELYYVRK
jgi:hypothetical protein